MTTNALAVTLASGDPLDVRTFNVEERLSRLFEVRLTAVSSSVDVDFEAAIGQEARFEVLRTSAVDGETRYWSGICADISQIEVEESGLSTYAIRIVPTMWLLTQRRNYKVFQDKSELDIALEVLSGWGIQPTLHLDAGSYPKRRIRIQYAETDFDFVNRLLEDIGAAYYFEQDGGATSLVLSDCPNKATARGLPVTFVDTPNERVAHEYVTAVRTGRHLRPGRYTQSDVDYRKALNYPLAASSTQGNAVEASLERYHHNYGSFLWKTDGGGDTPVADDRGAARTNEREGGKQVGKRLDAQRADARTCSFRTIAHDLRPGKVFVIAGHPRADVGAPLLVVAGAFSGNAFGEWAHTCECGYADADYRPPLVTPRPRTLGVESATVTGPAGEEIHTDEFGRMRVKFHWDREGKDDETSSCWVPLSQPWAGAGFGNVSLARVGQEVLVDFLGADPDRPVIVGRVFTTTTPPPYQLPKYKMVSGHRSESYPRPKSAPAQARLGGGPAEAAPPWAEPPSQPAGGGLPATGLGADDGAPPPALQGPLSGSQTSSSNFGSMVQANNAGGPDGVDHTRSANGLVHDDTAGQEKMYLQAQKDLFKAVKNNHVANVGNNQVCTVAQNDTNIVGAYEYTHVTMDRTVTVGGDQTHLVTGDINVRSDKNITTVTPSGSQVHLADQGIMLQVGHGSPSTILMLPNAIIIDAQEVYINPGPTFMAALAAGRSVAQAKAAEKAQEQIEANDKKIEHWKQQREANEGLLDKAKTDPMVGSVSGYQGLIDQDNANIDNLQSQNESLGRIVSGGPTQGPN